jgi:hypothetical protein
MGEETVAARLVENWRVEAMPEETSNPHDEEPLPLPCPRFSRRRMPLTVEGDGI